MVVFGCDLELKLWDAEIGNPLPASLEVDSVSSVFIYRTTNKLSFIDTMIVGSWSRDL